MKIIIIYFSPSGNTRKVAQQMSSSFIEKNHTVDCVDLTRNISYWSSSQFKRNLYLLINSYDVICVGSPVYAHHMHYNVLDFISNLLPYPGKFQYAIPFVTYGGINSGEALHDAEKLFSKKGRIVIGGIKINSEHCLSKAFKTDYNNGLPGKTAIPFLDELAEKISKLENKKIESKGYFLNYQKLMVRIRTKLLIGEKFWHKKLYPKAIFDYSKCDGCGVCASKCPLLRIELKETKPIIGCKVPECIHCGMCVFSCKKGGIYFNADMEKWEKMFIKATQGKGPIVSNEYPKTLTYYPG